MYRLFVAVGIAFLVTGCSAAPQATRPPLTADSINAALGASGLPIGDIRVFTANNDPNNLLGRPNQYVGKVSWKDSRGGEDDATIEWFSDAAALKARKDYTEAISKTGGPFTQYIVANEARLALMRLPRGLTPEQVEAYKTWFAAL